jgi:hypothetical protein
MLAIRRLTAASLLALSCGALPATVAAQQPAAPAVPAAPAAAPAPNLPKHSCVKPGEHPGRLASDTQQRLWTRSVNAYLECLKKFVTEEQAIAKPLIEQSKPHIEAANLAIDEYNKSSKEFREQLDKLDQ